METVALDKLPQPPIVPNGKRYWVLAPKKDKTVHQIGQFKLEETADKKAPPLQGRVVAIGDGDRVVNTKEFTPRCKYRRGDLVIFGAYAGNDHHWDGIDYLILHEDEILGHVIETPFDERDTTDLTQQHQGE
jgi:chaperonin GroES